MNFFEFISKLDEPINEQRKGLGLVSVYEEMKTLNDTLPCGTYRVISGVDDPWGDLKIGNSYFVKYLGCGLRRQDDESVIHGANCPLWTFVEFIE